MTTQIDERPAVPGTAFQILSLVVGVIGLAICGAAAMSVPSRLFPSYLVGFGFWCGISLGSLAIIMLNQLVGGEWGVPLRRPLEASAATLPLMGALFAPIILGMNSLYAWADRSAVEHSENLARKAAYLNPQAFTIRSIAYFVIWSAMAWLLLVLSRKRDTTESASPSLWMSRLSGPGMAVYVLTASFAAIDWYMSREADWASTIYGAMIITGQALSAYSMMILVVALLARRGGEMGDAVTPDRLNDLGNLLLAFIMLWAYMAFSQYLIIWSGNLAEEIPWYLRRTSGGWNLVAISLIAFHFVAPFAALCVRESKRRREVLLSIAAGIMVMRVLDLSWLILPASTDLKIGAGSWLDAPLVLAALCGVGGLWMALFLRILGSAPVIPLRDSITGSPMAPPRRHHG